MNNVFLPEIETEAVLNEIKSNMNRFNEMVKGTHAVNPEQCDQQLQFNYLEDAVNSIDVAQKHSAVGSELPPMYSMKGVKRKIATFLGKLLLRAGLIFTRDQRIYNQSVLDSISHMCLGIKAQEQKIYNLSKQLSDFSTTGLEGIKRESELSLKENLHHEIKLLTGRLEKAYPKICQIDKSHLDNLYLAFEDRFRGSCQRVREHVKNYIPFIAEAKAGTPEYPVLDVGCGRGEWLELLTEAGFVARGVDVNQSMAEQGREKGLNVYCADLFDFLSGLVDSSLGAITAFHVVEHLEFDLLLQFLDEVVRVLRPGGLAIFETPNPHNVLVGSCYFYNDPSHKNPILPEALQFFVKAKGLSKVEIKMFNPMDEWRLPEDGSLLTERFNEYFFGPQDYAVLGWKS